MWFTTVLTPAMAFAALMACSIFAGELASPVRITVPSFTRTSIFWFFRVAFLARVSRSANSMSTSAELGLTFKSVEGGGGGLLLWKRKKPITRIKTTRPAAGPILFEGMSPAAGRAAILLLFCGASSKTVSATAILPVAGIFPVADGDPVGLGGAEVTGGAAAFTGAGAG